MDGNFYTKNFNFMFTERVIILLLFFLLCQFPLKLISQDSIKVKNSDSTEIIRPLPKWLLDQKKNQTVKNGHPSEVLKSNNYFLYSILLTIILLFVIVISVSIAIVKRSRQTN